MKVAVDWDGVIHSYVSGWKGHSVLPDPPVEGAIAWLADLHAAGIEVVFFTCRFTNWSNEIPWPKVRDACIKYLIDNGLAPEIANSFEWWAGEGKPRVDLYVDDHGFRFEGTFPTVQEVKGLKDSWNKHLWKRGGDE